MGETLIAAAQQIGMPTGPVSLGSQLGTLLSIAPVGHQEMSFLVSEGLSRSIWLCCLGLKRGRGPLAESG